MNLEPINELDREHEQIVLSCMFRCTSNIADAVGMLRDSDFYFDAHQKIFAALVSVWEKTDATVDIIDAGRVAQELTDRGHYADVGGKPYILQVIAADPLGVNLQYRAVFVRESSIRRQLILAAQQTLSDISEQNGSPDELLGQAQARMLAIGADNDASATKPLRMVVSDVNNEIDRRVSKQSLTGVPSGLIDLDELTAGFQPGEFCILAARPSVGKTAMAANICVNAAEAGFEPLFISIEQSAKELATRMICGRALVNSYAIRTGRLDEGQISRLLKSGTELSDLPIWINDSPVQFVRNINATARRLMAKQAIKLVVIDYLQFITPDDKRLQRHEQISQMTRALKLLARELSIPVICLAQLNRDADDTTRPKLSHLRESGSIEQDADTVIFLHRDAPQNHKEPTERIIAIVAKQRNGPCGDVELVYRKAALKFENAAPEIPS